MLGGSIARIYSPRATGRSGRPRTVNGENDDLGRMVLLATSSYSVSRLVMSGAAGAASSMAASTIFRSACWGLTSTARGPPGQGPCRQGRTGGPYHGHSQRPRRPRDVHGIPRSGYGWGDGSQVCGPRTWPAPRVPSSRSGTTRRLPAPPSLRLPGLSHWCSIRGSALAPPVGS